MDSRTDRRTDDGEFNSKMPRLIWKLYYEKFKMNGNTILSENICDLLLI